MKSHPGSRLMPNILEDIAEAARRLAAGEELGRYYSGIVLRALRDLMTSRERAEAFGETAKEGR